jgi:retinol dehydrogenase-14
MKEKTVLVTGANSGIGKVTALALARMGAHVVMLCRNKERGEAAQKEIIRESSNEQVDLMICDLSCMDSVHAFANDFLLRYNRLDVQVNNAGGYFDRRIKTADGYEYTFAMNHLGHFLLTNRLLDLIRYSAPARIINVSSNAHQTGHIRFDDLMAEKRYMGWRAYSQAKLANILFAYELDKRLQGTGVTVNAVHPGFVNTNFANNTSPFIKPMVRLAQCFARSPEKGAETSIYLASSPDVEGISGKYFFDKKERSSNRESYDKKIAKRLWDVSEDLVNTI